MAGKDSSTSEGVFAGLRFFVLQQVPSRAYMIERIKSNGGSVVKLEGNGIHRIADHARKDAPDGSISWKYINDALKTGSLPDLSPYIIHTSTGPNRPAGSTIVGRRAARVEYTADQQKMLLKYVKQELGRDETLGPSSKSIYQNFAKVHPEHTWQSWLDHFKRNLQHLLPSRQDLAQEYMAQQGEDNITAMEPEVIAPDSSRKEAAGTTKTDLPVNTTQASISTNSEIAPTAVTSRTQAGTSPPRVYPKVPFTSREDGLLLDHVRRQTEKGLRPNYTAFAALYSEHSADSWRSRYTLLTAKAARRTASAASSASPAPLSRAGPETPSKRTRTSFTAHDDLVLYRFVESKQFVDSHGKAMYRELARINPRHTSESWRTRFIQKLESSPPTGELLERTGGVSKFAPEDPIPDSEKLFLSNEQRALVERILRRRPCDSKLQRFTRLEIAHLVLNMPDLKVKTLNPDDMTPWVNWENEIESSKTAEDWKALYYDIILQEAGDEQVGQAKTDLLFEGVETPLTRSPAPREVPSRKRHIVGTSHLTANPGDTNALSTASKTSRDSNQVVGNPSTGPVAATITLDELRAKKRKASESLGGILSKRQNTNEDNENSMSDDGQISKFRKPSRIDEAHLRGSETRRDMLFEQAAHRQQAIQLEKDHYSASPAPSHRLTAANLAAQTAQHAEESFMDISGDLRAMHEPENQHALLSIMEHSPSEEVSGQLRPEMTIPESNVELDDTSREAHTITRDNETQDPFEHDSQQQDTVTTNFDGPSTPQQYFTVPQDFNESHSQQTVYTEVPVPGSPHSAASNSYLTSSLQRLGRRSTIQASQSHDIAAIQDNSTSYDVNINAPSLQHDNDDTPNPDPSQYSFELDLTFVSPVKAASTTTRPEQKRQFILNTQAIMNAETQALDIDMLEPVDSLGSSPTPSQMWFTEHSTQENAAAEMADVEEDIEVYIDRWLAAGRTEGDIHQALYDCSGRASMAEKLLVYRTEGRTVEAGSWKWTAEEDEILQSSDARSLARLEKLHGQAEYNIRLRFLQDMIDSQKE